MSKITEPVAREFICVVDYSRVMLSDMLAQNLGQRSRGEVILKGMSSESWCPLNIHPDVCPVVIYFRLFHSTSGSRFLH